MIGDIVRLLITAACLLFVISLPFSKTHTGSTLRRWAAVCFILAFLPSIFGGLFYPAATTSTSPTSPTSSTSSSSPTTSTTPSVPSPSVLAPANDFFSTLGCAAAVLIVAFVAYGILRLRSRLTSKSKPRDPWESFFNRGGGKRPFTMNPRAMRSRGPFGLGDDEDED